MHTSAKPLFESEYPTPDDAALLRQATASDIDTLIELNKLCFPSMAEEGVVWTREQLQSHLRVFPQGQIIVERSGRVLGAVASLIIEMGNDPYRAHDYEGVTGGGFFRNHDPEGDTLYGADVYVHPDVRGQGLGHLLYDARRELCRWLNLRRIAAGGRLQGYAAYAAEMTPAEYVAAVTRGEIHDAVLSFQLREGFVIRGVMGRYIRDPLSCDYAAFVEWENPDYRAPLSRQVARRPRTLTGRRSGLEPRSPEG